MTDRYSPKNLINTWLLFDMACNVKPQFEVSVSDGDTEDSLLQHHEVPSNIQSVKVVDYFHNQS